MSGSRAGRRRCVSKSRSPHAQKHAKRTNTDGTQVAGRAPAFVAPTPLAANSFDDNGVLVRNRTDVAVCEGYPLALDLWASDGNAGDKVRHSFRAFASLCTL